MDPDSSAIPYLTAAGDLIGTALLGIAFHVLDAIGDGDSDVGDWTLEKVILLIRKKKTITLLLKKKSFEIFT